jgi:hypothetical protein
MQHKNLIVILAALLALLATACDKGETRSDPAPASAAGSAPAQGMDKAMDKEATPAKDKMAGDEMAAAFDHSALDKLLKQYVTPEGGVRYAEWKKDEAALKALDAYVAKVSQADASKLGDKQRLAFYINAYNANTLKAVLDRYPIKSVMDVKGFFDGIKYKVAGEEMTLNDLEGKKIREAFKEPRIHFVVNCASASCPILRRDALTASNLEAQLEAGTKQYVLQETKVDAAKKVVDTSKIFEWYKDDFKVAGGVNAFLAKYLPADQAAVAKEATVTTHEYGWALNEAK